METKNTLRVARSGRKGLRVEGREGRKSLNMYEWPMDTVNRLRIDYECGDTLGRGEQRGKNWDICNRITIKKSLK